MAARLHTRLTDQPLSVEAAHAFCGDPAAGALVVFAGTVRDHADDDALAAAPRTVVGLSYEADETSVGDQLQQLAADVAAKWPAVAVWIEHRVGDLAVGEPAVVVGVSAGHRPDAFEAARHAIDTLKATVAIWKQEHFADGSSHWPGSP